jgi:ribokinase
MATVMPGLLVIGLASLDTLHLPGRAPLEAAGGAGLYTALGMAAAGVEVSLFAPRLRAWPASLRPAAARLAWLGPLVEPVDLPRLEIAHHGGGRATLIGASWGGEAALDPAGLPGDLGRFDIVHIAALRSAARQSAFAAACLARGVRALSIGTYGRIAQAETATVRGLLAAADFFFMNENEAGFVLGPGEPSSYVSRPGLAQTATFITQAERGAWALSLGRACHAPAAPADELDPTGAGDVLCGTTLARIALGDDPCAAARAGVIAAGRVIEQPGPAALLD